MIREQLTKARGPLELSQPRSTSVIRRAPPWLVRHELASRSPPCPEDGSAVDLALATRPAPGASRPRFRPSRLIRLIFLNARKLHAAAEPQSASATARITLVPLSNASRPMLSFG